MHSLAGTWNGHDVGLVRRSNLSMLGGLCLLFQRHDVLTLECLSAFCWLLPWRSSSKPYKAHISWLSPSRTCSSAFADIDRKACWFRAPDIV